MEQAKSKQFARARGVRKWLRATLPAIALSCNCASATVYELPPDGSAVIGHEGRTRSAREDTLLDIARQYSVGYEEMLRANPGVDVWLPGDNTSILLPNRHILPAGPREGIVVNLPEHRLYYYPRRRAGERAVVLTYPVGIGKSDWHSPVGQTWILTKERNPRWYPTASIRREHAANGELLPEFIPAGPNNPLGGFKMRLALGDGTYEIHSTNIPLGIGMAVTHGCILMYPEDLASLYPLVPIGTKVSLINEPVKVTYAGGNLLIEAHPALDSGAHYFTHADFESLALSLERAFGTRKGAIHWDFVRQVLQTATGMPTVIGFATENSVRAQAH
jgi:L,D-transpeptidase ErfK/SrfK